MRANFLIPAIICAVVSQTPAQAQSQLYVASGGSDAASCLRNAPCLTFSGALSKSQAGGTISCLDNGSFGNIVISATLTIDCATQQAFAGTVYVTGTAATDVFTLRGLTLTGFTVLTVPVSAQILFDGAGTLRLDKLVVLDTKIAFPGASGVAFVPSGTAKLDVLDSVFVNNGGTGTAAGILVKPGSGVQATVAIERTTIQENRFGIFLDGTAGGIIRGLVTDSIVSGNVLNGISVNTAGANVGLTVDNTKVSGNNIGVAAGGTNGLILVRRSTITANNTGLSAGGGGSLVTYRDNLLNNNTTDGTFSFALGTQ